MRCQAGSPAMLAAGLPFDDRMLGQVVHALHGLPGDALKLMPMAPAAVEMEPVASMRSSSSR